MDKLSSVVGLAMRTGSFIIYLSVRIANDDRALKGWV